MPSSLSALDLLLEPVSPERLAEASMIAIVGDDSFLAGEMVGRLRESLCPDEADRSWAWREFAGDAIDDPRDVFDEAATVAMFATATRTAVVRSADGFVTKARAALEQLASSRGSRGLLVLEVKSLPGNTRLAKAIATNGLVIEAAVPPRTNLTAWLRRWAKAAHGCTVPVATAERLVERLGNDLGQIMQAVQRLHAASGSTIPPEAVDDLAGGPQERSAWQMAEAASSGQAAAAVAMLTDLLEAGENPIGLTAQTAAVFKRLSTAARLLSLPRDGGRPASLEDALRQAGVAAWPKALDAAREALVRLGPERARALPFWLLATDRALKGDASRGLRSRLALERLICKMRVDDTSRRPPAEAARPQRSSRRPASRR
jgi:DNA polymerase III subunit delta